MICACTDMSSADVGSSRMMNSGFKHNRPRNGDPLPLPAGKFVRIAVAKTGVYPHLLQSRDHLLFALNRRQLPKCTNSPSSTICDTDRRGDRET